MSQLPYLPHISPIHLIPSAPGLGGLKETKMFLPHPRVKVSIVESLRDREVACSASDRQGSNFESCVWRTVSSQSSHHPQEVILAQFSLYVHKGGLMPDSFHFHFVRLEGRGKYRCTNPVSAPLSASYIAHPPHPTAASRPPYTNKQQLLLFPFDTILLSQQTRDINLMLVQ